MPEVFLWIQVHKKTDAYQRNENLLLSSLSHATSEPALEIKANDVRCTHGATISSIGTEELWYMMSRGISEDVARDLIADGFLKKRVAAYSGFEKACYN